MYNKQVFEFHDIPKLKKMVVIILELKKGFSYYYTCTRRTLG